MSQATFLRDSYKNFIGEFYVDDLCLDAIDFASGLFSSCWKREIQRLLKLAEVK